MRRKSRILSAVLLVAGSAGASHITPAAERGFQTYIREVEARLGRQHASPQTYIAGLGREGESTLGPGEVRVEPVHGGTWQSGGALLHHWRAVALIPDVTAEEMLALLRDYNHLSAYYAPEVVSSYGLVEERDGAKVAMRLQKRQIVTVVLDAEFDVQNGLTALGGGYSISRSTHIWQVDQAGTPREHRRAEGADDGFLWRLNSYWSFQNSRDGLLVECEAVSLTRDVPVGLGWLIGPIVQNLPRSSLEFTLTATRNALIRRQARRHSDEHAN